MVFGTAGILSGFYFAFEEKQNNDKVGISTIYKNIEWQHGLLQSYSRVHDCCLKFCRFDSAVLSGVTLMLFACIVWLKLVSYAHTSYDMRVLAKSVDKVRTRTFPFSNVTSFGICPFLI